MSAFPPAAAWRAACARDATLSAWAGPWSVCFAIAVDGAPTVLALEEGRVTAGAAIPAFTLEAPASVWAKFLEPIPPRHHHGLFAMLYRVPAFRVDGDQLTLMQHAHVARRVLEIGKWLALGRAEPVPAEIGPRGGVPPMPRVEGRYVPVTVDGTTYQIYTESAGSGRPILCMHTAGADGRQFHWLMADPALTATHRLLSFDLPFHGKSPPPPGAIPGAWRLNTDLYVALIMGFVAAMTVVTDLASDAGVFQWGADRIRRRAGGRSYVLWLLLAAMAVLSTIFLSIDTTAVLLTPVVVTVTRQTGLPVLPFALATVWLANTASLLLPVSNLTNLLAQHNLDGISPAGFATLMWASSLAAIIIPLAFIALVFRRDLQRRYAPGPKKMIDPGSRTSIPGKHRADRILLPGTAAVLLL
ncbi:MAG: hypothetical protein J0H99_02185, partial [Rhodospirillales bacterium]|nr:hypothetical protein [Rhodospirillales bacterium]